MLNTQKSIIKNFKACCLKDGEELVFNYLCRSSKMKKAFVLAYTNQNRFLMGSVKVFGKMTLLEEFSATDVKHLEMGVKTGIAANYFLKINYHLKEDFFRSQMVNPSDFLKQIYSQNPDSKPDYLKEGDFIEALAVKKDMLFVFATNKLIILNFDGKNISVQKEIDYAQITDFDIYTQKIGSYKNFYFEIDSKPELYLVDLIRPNDDYINYFSEIFKLTTIPKPVPSFMEADEQEIITYTLTKQMGAGLGKNKLRVASKNVYILEKNNDGKLIPTATIAISNIESIKADTLGTALKTGGNNHEIIINTKDGKKYNLWNTDQETQAANKALDYIQKNIT